MLPDRMCVDRNSTGLMGFTVNCNVLNLVSFESGRELVFFFSLWIGSGMRRELRGLNGFSYALNVCGHGLAWNFELVGYCINGSFELLSLNFQI